MATAAGRVPAERLWVAADVAGDGEGDADLLGLGDIDCRLLVPYLRADAIAADHGYSAEPSRKPQVQDKFADEEYS